MLKCPYCYEILEQRTLQCPHCQQYFLDDILNLDFAGANKKNCLYCGKKILAEAKICRHCKKWLDDLDQRANDVDLDDLV